jgi:membrane-associated phospholipid phosphatase
LFNDTMSDIGRLPSKENFALISLGFLAAMAGRPADQPLSDTLSGSLPLEDVFDPGKTVGGAPLQMGGALAAYTIGRFTGHPKVAQVGADLLRAQMVAQVVTTGVKIAVRRTRPDGTQYSFPSGHSSVTFASATILQRHFGWKVGLPAYGIASYVAASRIQEKRHYLSDVVFGAALGIAIGRTATIGRGDARFAVSPMPAPGGGGVSFTWIGPR